MKYSFVIPAYNNGLLLKNTLMALNQLTPIGRGDYEVIVVDDGSEDKCQRFINGINKEYDLKYIYLERDEESSRAKSRNVGIRQAEGKYIVFIDADIIVNTNYLEELDRCYQLDKNIIVAGGRLLMKAALPEEICLENQLFTSNYLTAQHVDQEFREEVFRDLSYNGATMKNPFLFCFTCNLSVPKDEIEAIGGFDEALKKWGVEDVEMVYRLYQKGIKIVFNYKNEVVHQFHGNRQGKVVKKEQEEEVDYNSRIFSQKHIGAMGLDAQGIQKLFRSIAIEYKKLEKEILPEENCIQIDFKEANQLVQIKELLKEMIAKKVSHIMIYDYVEQTDLDIWIQLQETLGKQVKYYPISKII